MEINNYTKGVSNGTRKISGSRLQKWNNIKRKTSKLQNKNMYTLLARERLLFKLRVRFLKTLKNQKGVLTLGNTIDHNYISPAIYPGNKPEKQLSLLHSYHSIEECVPKSDILG